MSSETKPSSGAPEDLKTITLSPPGDDDNPMITLCIGHVDAATFTKAHENEGWEADPAQDSDLSFEYWKPLGNGSWSSSNKDAPGAVAVTVMEW